MGKEQPGKRNHEGNANANEQTASQNQPHQNAGDANRHDYGV